jgi:acyl carrier protein
MNEPEIYTTLSSIFHDIFDDDSIRLTPETTANDIEDWNSLTHVSLITAIEARFKIRFKTAELEELHSVGHLVELIERKLGAKA